MLRRSSPAPTRQPAPRSTEGTSAVTLAVPSTSASVIRTGPGDRGLSYGSPPGGSGGRFLRPLQERRACFPVVLPSGGPRPGSFLGGGLSRVGPLGIDGRGWPSLPKPRGRRDRCGRSHPGASVGSAGPPRPGGESPGATGVSGGCHRYGRWPVNPARRRRRAAATGGTWGTLRSPARDRPSSRPCHSACRS